MAWHKESRRHALASKGIKTTTQPVTRVADLMANKKVIVGSEMKALQEKDKKEASRLIFDAMEEWTEERDFDRQKEVIERLKELGVTKKQYLDTLEENNHYMLGEWVEENWDVTYELVPIKR